MKIGLTGGILQSIVCSDPLLFWPSIFISDQSSISVFWEWGQGPLNWENKHVNSGKREKMKYAKSTLNKLEVHYIKFKSLYDLVLWLAFK